MARPQTLEQSLPGIRRFIVRFWPYIRTQRTLISGSMLALFIEVGLRLLEPWPLKFIFDRVITTAPSGGLSGISIIDNMDPMTLLTFSAFAVVTIAGLRAIAAYSNTVGFALIGNRVLTKVRNDLFRHLQFVSLSFHNRSRSGDLIIRVIDDVGILKEVTVTAILPLLANFLILAGMVAVMFWLNWELALLAMMIFPLFWLSTIRISRNIQHVARKQRKREGAMAATAAESFGAIKVVQALSLDANFTQVFSDQSNKDLKVGVKAKRLQASLERTVDILIAFATAMVLWYGATLVLDNIFTPGDLLVFLFYLKSAFRPIRDTAKYTGRLAKATAACERVVDLLEIEPEVRDLPDAVPAPALRGGIRFEGVSFAYEPGQPVLEDISFEVHPGQYIALVGPSGAGKSTLISLILRLYDPMQGRIMIDGRDIRKYTVASLRQQISVVLQDNILFAASIRDNIAYGAPDATPGEIEAAARLANAHEFIGALPQGYDTILGERGVTLSSGQRQRIAIARAAIRKAPILILDEPTSSLDRENQRAVIQALERLAHGSTTFLLTHDMEFASSADLILYLENGRVIECGTHEELMKASGRYSTLYRLQSALHEYTAHRG
ncbi:ABC-type multidrug transport system, ATPase and permease component [Candidatus Methanoperedens nitroreducens]|uniref:ABC-type multidrug transport system, ATPase and permease component n=1 Tax=Candidatus Methanoperedens nitratireducens TaxID=1392998 RepID=A0A062V2V5_9EURY|nr:ABC transporter ATP-binding protein [Candidatus Methanoperedens nitroreducens]KCZ73406.1 ABC-type multidrug transport system, ATPase and permease component [Candidatus Methanoperedens nitroreducens]MDJ1422639.1 ABC transporter ATP-binding protein [Candidatus Methanoperedens sp.]